MALFRDIPKFPRSHYNVDVSLCDIKETLERYQSQGLNMNPDFQRGHIWTEKQQIEFIRYVLQGGETTSIYFNCPGFRSGSRPKGKFVCVDGKQRLTAALAFLNDKFKPFDHFYSEYVDFDYSLTFRFHIAELETKVKVLRWYLAINSGGTPHSNDELDRVKRLLLAEKDIKTI